MAMPKGRPKGSTGTYFRWPPEKIAELWEDADILASRPDILASRRGRLNKSRVAWELKQQFPEKYRHITEGHLRQQLDREYQHRKRKRETTVAEADAFNAGVLAHLLRKNEEK